MNRKLWLNFGFKSGDEFIVFFFQNNVNSIEDFKVLLVPVHQECRVFTSNATIETYRFPDRLQIFLGKIILDT